MHFERVRHFFSSSFAVKSNGTTLKVFFSGSEKKKNACEKNNVYPIDNRLDFTSIGIT